MAKDIKTLNDNQTAKNNQRTEESSSFSAPNANIKTTEVYKYLYQTVREIKYLGPRFLNETFINLTKNLIDTNNTLTNEYIYKFNDNVAIIDELYSNYLTKITNYNQVLKSNLAELQKANDKVIKQLDTQLLEFQQEAILRYKALENLYLPKNNFLVNNKKVNKEEYIKLVTDINQKRIIANQKYLHIANDLTSKNEQQQFQFKHNIDNAIEQNSYDKSIISDDIEAKIIDINNFLEDKEKEHTNYINKKHRSIIDNTIKINDYITNFSLEFENHQKQGDIPFNITENKSIEELNDNIQTYSDLENQVLDEFKELLQQNDSEIDTFRQTHRLFEEMQIAKIKQMKKDCDANISKESKLYAKEIANLAKIDSPENKQKIKELETKRDASISSIKKEYEKNLEPIKKVFQEKQLEYIEKNEKLRIRKSECEAVKSSAVKNINYEKGYHHDRINDEIKLNSQERETFSIKDKHDHNKAIYKHRLKGDVEKENIQFEINEKELETYEEKIISKYEIDKLLLEKDYKFNLSDEDLAYQKEAIRNRINFHNVKTMLEIQKQQLISDFETMSANEKMNFEQVKNSFYNNCDNIQYELYKIDNEIKYKMIDIELNFKQSLVEQEKQHKKTLLNYERRSLNNENEYRENLTNIELYENRLTIEKNLLNATNELFINSLRNVIELDNYIHSSLSSISRSCYEESKGQLLLSIEHLRKVKLALLNDYYNNEVNILKARIEFEKDIKFKKIYENTKKEWNKFAALSKSKCDKITQTINSYKNTLETSKKALIEKKDEKKKLKRKLFKLLLKHKNSLGKSENLRKEIKTLNEYITLIKRQITANKENIRKQKNLEKEQIKRIKETDKKYNKTYIEIDKNQNAEARVYNDSLSLIQQQYNKIKADIIRTSSIYSVSKYTYANLSKNATAINELNNKLILNVKNNYDIHFNKLINDLEKRYSILKTDYQLNYKGLHKEKTNLVEIENNSNATTIHTIENEYNSGIETLERELNIAKNKLNNNLKKLNLHHISNLNSFNKKITKIEENRRYELKCHDENYKMYLEKFNENNTLIIKKYLQKTDSIKLQYNKDRASLDEKHKKNLKNIKNQHISNDNLRKNNIQTLNNEFKEQVKKIDTKIKIVEDYRKQYQKNYLDEKNKKYKMYLENQENTRKEFDNQMKQITNKCQARIKTLQKEFIKEFKNKNGVVKV